MNGAARDRPAANDHARHCCRSSGILRRSIMSTRSPPNRLLPTAHADGGDTPLTSRHLQRSISARRCLTEYPPLFSPAREYAVFTRLIGATSTPQLNSWSSQADVISSCCTEHTSTAIEAVVDVSLQISGNGSNSPRLRRISRSQSFASGGGGGRGSTPINGGGGKRLQLWSEQTIDV